MLGTGQGAHMLLRGGTVLKEALVGPPTDCPQGSLLPRTGCSSLLHANELVRVLFTHAIHDPQPEGSPSFSPTFGAHLAEACSDFLHGTVLPWWYARFCNHLFTSSLLQELFLQQGSCLTHLCNPSAEPWVSQTAGTQ